MAKSNSSRIEAATRQHVGAVLTSQMLAELVKASEPEWKGGVYPSDCAYKRQEDGVLVPRGKTAYGDGVLEYLAENSFKVLPTEQIVRRKPLVKKAEVPVPAVAPVAATPTASSPVASAPAVPKKKGKKASTSASQPPSAAKRPGAAGRATL
jgi:hypothetical protein